MNINAQFDQRVIVHSAAMAWVPSPMPGVERKMLDRLGGEVARATSIVRYAPGSSFSAHVHHGGEEFLVLDGVFQDEHGDYPAGTYIRNPPESSHVPRSEQGCTIFVKLWQFETHDRVQICVDTLAELENVKEAASGMISLLLFDAENEKVTLERWPPSSAFEIDVPDGMEVLCIDGKVEESGDTLVPGSWLRLPKNSSGVFRTGECGARLWLKSKHLKEMPGQPQS